MKTAMLFFAALWFIFGGLILMGFLPALERWNIARIKRQWGVWAPPWSWTVDEMPRFIRGFYQFMGAIGFLVGCLAVVGAVYMMTQ